VTRDSSQGKYANRIPLDHPLTLDIFTLWGKLNHLGRPMFGTIEMGGASVQVDENFLRRDYTQTARRLRAAAPSTPIRPLWRGANSFLLKPAHENDLFWLLRQFADDVAPIQSPHPELLRVKVFDSQGILKEVASTVRMVATLRDQGYPVSVEIAIPYSNGEGRDTFNPYPDQFFIERVIEAADIGKAHGIPTHAFKISLKDMVGELRKGQAGNLIGKMIDALRSKGYSNPLELHLHDTGFALDAYVDAINVCRQENWLLGVDTVGGDNSGFVNTIQLIDTLRDSHIDVGISKEQLEILHTIDAIQNQLRDLYAPARSPEIFSGDDLRRYAIPGGGEASFINAVKSGGFASLLGLSEIDAMHVAGTALMAVGKLMGHALPVTPGFQNKQIAALNFINNMVTNNRTARGNREQTEKALLSSLSEQEVNDLFLNNLNPVVREFLRGEMPTNVHPAILKALGKRDGLLTDAQTSQLPSAQTVVAELQKQGFVDANESAYRSAVARALIHGPNEFAALQKKPHLGREPDPSLFKTAAEWEIAKKRIPAIRSAGIPDPYAQTAVLAERFFGKQHDPKTWQLLLPESERLPVAPKK
jgi:pyruvate carboxylase